MSVLFLSKILIAISCSLPLFQTITRYGEIIYQQRHCSRCR
nr:MAG TPA: membrane protein [Caudoviricetes sp.]